MNNQRTEPPLEELCSALVGAQDRFRGDESGPGDCEHFLDAADSMDQGRRRLRSWAAVAAGLIACLSVVFWLVRSEHEPEVFVGAARVPQRAGAWLAASEQPLPMFFSDGSNVELESEACVRVVELSSGAAHLTLEMGQIRAWVVTSDTSSRWQFDAGPFTVYGSQMQFVLSWDPEAQLFEITLSQGAVSVDGPILGESKWVEFGHSLRVSIPDSLAVLTSLVDPPVEAVSAPAPQ